MALFRPILGELSGSVANNTFSHNKGGSYARNRSIPTNPNSSRQQASRTILAELSARWSTLTQTQRDQWDAWAAANPIPNALGEPILRTGHQAYLGLGARMEAVGQTAATTPPVAMAPAGLATATIAIVGANVQVTFTPTPTGAGIRVVLWQTIPGSAGQNPNINQARLVGYSDPAQASPASIPQLFVGIAGQVSNFWVGTMRQTDGQTSQLIKARYPF